MKYTKSITGFLCLVASNIATASLLFSAPPTQTYEEAVKIYTPVIEKLSEALDQPIDFKYPRDWIEYSKMIQSGEFQIAFDQPHFVAWRSKLGSESLYHRPVVKLSGDLKYSVITRADTTFNKLKDLNSRRICSVPSPSLGAVVITQLYTNPVIQPSMIPVKTDQDAINKLLKKRCDAAIVNHYDFSTQHVNNENLKEIYTSAPYPNYTIAVTPQFQDVDLEKIQAIFLDENAPANFELLFKTFGQGNTQFEPTNNEAFTNYNILEGFLFDW